MILSGKYESIDKYRRPIVSSAIIGVAAAIIAILMFQTWLVSHYELRTLDYLHRHKLSRKGTEISDKIFLVEVDDTTVKRLGWPLRRSYYAKLIKLLLGSGAKVIAFDIVFSDPGRSPGEDRELADATKGNESVIHAAIFSEVNQSSVEENAASLEKFSFEYNISVEYRTGKDMLPATRRVLLPMHELLESAESLADISIEPDEDGIVRRMPLIREYEGRLYSCLSLAAVCRFLNIKPQDILISPGKQINLIDENRNIIRIPTDARGRILVNYANPNSYNQIECSFLWLLQKFGQLADGEEPDDMPELKGKLVLIGKVVTGDVDQRPTPFIASFSMLRIHANVISNILQQNFLKEAPGYLGPALSIILSLSIAYLVFLSRPVLSALISLLMLISCAFFSYYLFVYQNMLSPFLMPLLAMSVSFSSSSFYRYISEKKRINRIEQELHEAEAMQRSILPSADPVFAGLDISSYFQPATEIGGDYYDYIIITETMLAIAIGDVKGHGIQAGLLVSAASGCLHTSLETTQSVAEVIRVMNRRVCGVTGRTLMTFCFSILDTIESTITFCSAGHPFPYHYCATTQELVPWELQGSFPLGVQQDFDYPVCSRPLASDDVLVYYSDGLVEGTNSAGEMFGFERLEAAIVQYAYQTVSDIKESILTEFRNHCQQHEQEDDVTLIVTKVR